MLICSLQSTSSTSGNSSADWQNNFQFPGNLKSSLFQVSARYDSEREVAANIEITGTNRTHRVPLRLGISLGGQYTGFVVQHGRGVWVVLKVNKWIGCQRFEACIQPSMGRKCYTNISA